MARVAAKVVIEKLEKQLRETVQFFASLSNSDADAIAALKQKLADSIDAQIRQLDAVDLTTSSSLNLAIDASALDPSHKLVLQHSVCDRLSAVSKECNAAAAAVRSHNATQQWRFPDTYLTEPLVNVLKSGEFTWQRKVTVLAQLACAIRMPHPNEETLGFLLAPLVEWHFGGSHKMDAIMRYKICEKLREELSVQRKTTPLSMKNRSELIWEFPEDPRQLPSELYNDIYAENPPVLSTFQNLEGSAKAVIKRSSDKEYKAALVAHGNSGAPIAQTSALAVPGAPHVPMVSLANNDGSQLVTQVVSQVVNAIAASFQPMLASLTQASTTQAQALRFEQPSQPSVESRRTADLAAAAAEHRVRHSASPNDVQAESQLDDLFPAKAADPRQSTTMSQATESMQADQVQPPKVLPLTLEAHKDNPAPKVIYPPQVDTPATLPGVHPSSNGVDPSSHVPPSSTKAHAVPPSTPQAGAHNPAAPQQSATSFGGGMTGINAMEAFVAFIFVTNGLNIYCLVSRVGVRSFFLLGSGHCGSHCVYTRSADERLIKKQC